MSWYRIDHLHGRGARTEVVGGLAGLAAARKEHQGQFFTPLTVSRWMWGLIDAPLREAIRLQGGRRANVLDTCVGTGRLLAACHPDLHNLYGIDSDHAAIASLQGQLDTTDFAHHLVTGSLLDYHIRGHADVAVINPPFSLHWDSPTVAAYPCCAYGRFGAHSSTTSHLYAVHHACAHASVVLAIIPSTAIEVLTVQDCAPQRVYHLPRNIFAAEGAANVATSICVWNRNIETAPAQTLTAADLATPPEPLAFCFPLLGNMRLERTHIEPSTPAITTPVTGNPDVHIHRHGRHFRLRFACGLIEAKVRNALLRDAICDLDIGTRRLPPGITHTGQCVLDSEYYIAADRLIATLQQYLLAPIRDAGGNPVYGDGVLASLKRAHKRRQRAAIPFGRVVYDHATSTNDITASPRAHIKLTNCFGGPVLTAGTAITLTRTAGTSWETTYRGEQLTISSNDLHEHWELLSGSTASAVTGGWTTLYPNACDRLPAAHMRQVDARLKRAGIDTILTWDYQYEDCREVLAKGSNALIGWDMGLGKARLALSLCLVGGTRNLIVVESYLVDEMVREIRKHAIDPADWQVIQKPTDLRDLKKVNIISYARLRRPLDKKVARTTYADRLRRRMHTVVCDEAQALANPTSLTSKAIWALSPKRRYGMTGTPVRNYVRHLIPLLRWVGGDGTQLQPFGQRQPYYEAQNIKTCLYARRGEDVFRDRHMTMEWVTNQFADDLQNGAKREVPKLRNPTELHQVIAPLMKRRVSQEPAVAQHFTIPVPTIADELIEWDDRHLAHYLRVADDFAAWWRRVHVGDRAANLVSILARIGAVQSAANCPQEPLKDFSSYGAITPKEEHLVEEMEVLQQAGTRAIIYVRRPATADRLASLLGQAGVSALSYHGKQAPTSRNRRLYRDFVEGATTVLVATYGSCQAGLNLHMASAVYLFERGWTPSEENQAIARVLRPQQQNPVTVRRLHYAGSIDVYMAQMVAHKDAAASLAIDHDSSKAAIHGRFIHMDQILDRFVQDLQAFRHCDRSDLKDRLAHVPLAAHAA